jgi:nucleotide-binding universal stress UspA family protein
MKLHRILFPTDFSRCADQALLHALYMAEKYGAELHMLHVVVLHGYDPHNPDYEFPDVARGVERQVQDVAAEHMRTALNKHKIESVKVVKAQERGVRASRVIMEYAAGNEIDLIVMGTHGRRGLGHLFLGSVTEEVVRRVTCPVLTVRERQDPLTPKTLERILVPVDFSEYSRNAVAYAKELASSYRANLQLLHVVEHAIHPSFYIPAKSSLLDIMPDIKDKSRSELQNVLAGVKGPDMPAEFHVAEGHAAKEIIKFAEAQGSDLIVIATHGLTGIEHLLLGSTTEKVVRMAPCPVFTVKSFGKSLLE